MVKSLASSKALCVTSGVVVCHALALGVAGRIVGAAPCSVRLALLNEYDRAHT
jgi:hypothetical protein